MKKVIAIVMISGAIISCSIRESESKILGNWCSCAKNGDYVEMYFKENKYKYSTDFGIATNWNEFEIKGNTIYNVHDDQ